MKMWSHVETEIGKMIELIFQTDRLNFLEIGAHVFNMSTIFYLLSANGAKVVTIDAQLRNPDKLEIMKTFAPNFIFIQGDSNSEDTLGKVKSNCTCYDIVYIDGSHNYTQVKKDTEFYADLIKPSGYIIWHDYFVPGENCAKENGRFKGVKMCIDEYKERGISIQSFFEGGACLAYIRGEEWISSRK